MNRPRSIVGLLIVVAFCVLVGQAGDAQAIRVNIPFEFNVGNETLSAGQYVILVDRVAPGTPLGSRLVLRSSDGKTTRHLKTVPGRSDGTGSPRTSLSFRKYDQTYFLAKVSTPDTGCDLKRSSAEKELAARAIEPETVSAPAE